MLKSRFSGLLFQIIALALSFGVVSLILISIDASPTEAFRNMFKGSFGEMRKFAEVLVAFVPLLLVTAGLLVTFSAGLWNIGVEGQVVLGAIATTWVYRYFLESDLPPALIITLAILGGMIGGAIWAAFTGILKVFGGVNEIFGGLGLNFVATALTIYLIFGPWKRPGVASMSGTVPLPDEFSLPLLANLRISPWALGIALIAIIIVFFLLQGTYFGLKLKAVGKNFRAAYLLGIPTWQYAMYSFLICGALAGLAGAMQVAAVYHRLIPSISSGYGYLGLMVAMLINYQAIWAIPVALFFAALNIGSIQLPIMMKLDSSLSGVLQGVLVLFALLVEGARQKFIQEGAKHMTQETILIGLAGILAASAPIVFAVLGETLSERAGVINLSMNGTILLSAMGGFAVAYTTNNIVLGFLAGMLIGALVALIVAFASITLNQSQVAVGFVLALTCRDLSYFLGNPYMGVPGPRLQAMPIPFLSDIPILGALFFRQDAITYISFMAIILTWVWIYRTRPGLMLQGIGEKPAAAYIRGANVNLMRYVYTIIGGALIGLAGPAFSLASRAGWMGTISGLDGFGWIALSITIFGGWNPARAAFGAYLFGFLQWLGLVLQPVLTQVPSQVLQVAPFPLMILTLLLVNIGNAEWVERTLAAMPESTRKFFAKLLRAMRASPPAALGVPFERD